MRATSRPASRGCWPREAETTEICAQARHQISRWKNDFIDADTAPSQPPATPHRAILRRRLYRDYQRQYLLACNSMDFDDLIMLPLRLFREFPEVLHRWQDRIRYLLVDEYQDTNTSQYELVPAAVQAAPETDRGRRRRPVDLRLARRAPGEPAAPAAGLPGARRSSSSSRTTAPPAAFSAPPTS